MLRSFCRFLFLSSGLLVAFLGGSAFADGETATDVKGASPSIATAAREKGFMPRAFSNPYQWGEAHRQYALSLARRLELSEEKREALIAALKRAIAGKRDTGMMGLKPATLSDEALRAELEAILTPVQLESFDAINRRNREMKTDLAARSRVALLSQYFELSDGQREELYAIYHAESAAAQSRDDSVGSDEALNEAIKNVLTADQGRFYDDLVTATAKARAAREVVDVSKLLGKGDSQ